MCLLLPIALNTISLFFFPPAARHMWLQSSVMLQDIDS